MLISCLLSSCQSLWCTAWSWMYAWTTRVQGKGLGLFMLHWGSYSQTYWFSMWEFYWKRYYCVSLCKPNPFFSSSICVRKYTVIFRTAGSIRNCLQDLERGSCLVNLCPLAQEAASHCPLLHLWIPVCLVIEVQGALSPESPCWPPPSPRWLFLSCASPACCFSHLVTITHNLSPHLARPLVCEDQRNATWDSACYVFLANISQMNEDTCHFKGIWPLVEACCLSPALPAPGATSPPHAHPKLWWDIGDLHSTGYVGQKCAIFASRKQIIFIP